ncbi:cupin domain-containing protein [Tunturiibacter gelidoferens]|uniref:Quercetin dioxygenase-like cupin family protein n=1 Tax=Tunturiibacter gelidiferens TaxID=3069689 RepID=A0A9X0U3V8_9BACT|nr:cupin domain-containing protein [Edaphobacter lichenicola]MBB5328749.1 quercetin dioxygenase-like cupin family protein [Edaphobacter lichenicola]
MKTIQAYKRAPALENSTWYKGLLISQLAGNSDTDGAFDLVESKMKKGTEPPPHIHDREAELFYILAGEIKVFADGQVFTVVAGESVFLPKKIPHAYLIQSEECHVLALMTPGGFLNAINKINAPARTMEIPSDMETYATVDLTSTMAVFIKYGVRMMSPDEIAEQLPAYAIAH